MTALGVILRPVSFIFDPVPRCDRRRDDGGAQARTSTARMLIEAGSRVWLHPDLVDWAPLETAADRHPRSTPARLRPYDWAAQLAWPRAGWGLS